jgi:segregation and condensation protein B
MDEASELVDVTDSPDMDGAADAEAAPQADDDAIGRLERIIESVLFAAAAPVSLRRLVEILAGPSAKEVQAALARLKQLYEPGQRGIQLHEVAGGYQFRTARENAEWVRAVFRDKPARLGRAALETLAIVAYKQPVTRVEIEAIRGVDVDGVLTTLLSRRLIKISGRKEAVGRPLLYNTTPEFLETFGLKDVKELPSLKELGPAPETEDGESTAADEPQALIGVVPEEGTTPPQPEAGQPQTGQPAAGQPAAEQPETVQAAARQPESGQPETVQTAATQSEVGQPAAEQLAAGQPETAPPDAEAEHRVAEAAAATSGGTPAEDSESGGDCVAAGGGGADRGGARAGEWAGGDTAGDEGEPPDGSDHH